MGTVKKTIFFVLLPVLAVMIAAATGYHFHGYRQAKRAADDQLLSAAQLISELIAQEVEQIDHTLESIVWRGDLELYHMYTAVGLLDEAEDSRLWIEQAMERLAEVNPNVRRIEYFTTDGNRFVAVVDGERELAPANAKDQPWFAVAIDGAEYIGFESGKLLRLAAARDHEQAGKTVATILFDFVDAAGSAAEFATRHLEQTRVEVVDGNGTPQFNFGSLAADADLLEATVPLKRFGASVRLQQTKAAAMEEFYNGRNLLFFALAFVTVGLWVVAALGTNSVVRDLRQANRQTEKANQELRQHAKDLEETRNALEQRSTELALSNIALECSNVDLQQFAYVASHDLQEPLRAIKGFSRLLRLNYEGKLDETADDYLIWINQGVQRMQTLIDDLLGYSRVDSHSRPLEETDLGNAFDDAVARLGASISESGAEVTHDGLPTVVGDHSLLAQLLQNLISNGIKYHGDDAPRVRISATKDGDEWQISVRDNGIGIDAKQHDRIFELFRRLHARDNYPGTGIGLAVCRRIVQRHGGRIWLESAPGRGSTFFFTLAASS